ncbi:hypothetical protein BJV82DRAFT_610291 [Fennellomyces sp. T-0311]|nr:hypothetical protein BJV82DRAFT_610291 [Fennellomyces sp. T-0311]
MKFVHLLVVLAGTISSFTQAQTSSAGIAVTAPLQGTVWTAGKTEQVAWTVQDQSATTINTVELRNGGQGNLQVVGIVGKDLPIADGKWAWNIPVDTKTDSTYVLVFKSSKGDTYSPYFTIMAADPSAIASASASAAANSSASGSGAQASSTNDESGASTMYKSTLLAGGLSAAAIAGLLI